MRRRGFLELLQQSKRTNVVTPLQRTGFRRFAFRRNWFSSSQKASTSRPRHLSISFISPTYHQRTRCPGEMSYAKCPVCSAEFHLLVTGVGEWYRQRWPGLKIGEIVPEECPGCWTELREYHVVSVRRRPQSLPESSPVQIGERGAVVSVLTAPDGSKAYMVARVAYDSQTDQ
jgi:hypothetical protein